MMASQADAETLRTNRAESIARRPHVAVAAPSGMAKQYQGVTQIRAACDIPIDRIIPDADQPRKEFEAEPLEQLAASLKARGQLQPIRVRWSADVDRYVIVVGERRWRAATMAGLPTLACIIVKGDEDPGAILEDQLVENALREGLKPVEQARAYQALIEARGLTHRDLAERLHIAHTGVTRALALLELPEAVQEQVDAGTLPASSAHAIATNLDDPEAQREIAARVVDEGLSRAETVEAVKRAAGRPRAGGAKGRGGKATPKLPTERTVKTAVGLRVTVAGRKGFDVPAALAALDEARARLAAELEDDQAAA
jgi:ParB family chromosome partitioning protein